MRLLPVSIVLFMGNIGENKFQLWMQKRIEKGASYGLWEFPGGKIEANEDPDTAACREVLEETGMSVDKRNLLLFAIHSYVLRERKICLYVYLALFDKKQKAKGRWFDIDYTKGSGFLKGKIPEENHYLIDLLAEYLKKQEKMRDELWNLSSGG